MNYSASAVCTSWSDISCVHCMVSWWYPMLTFSSIACTQSAWAKGETVTSNHQNITKVNSSAAEVGVRCPKSPGWRSLPLSQPAVRCGAHRWQAATAQEPAAWDQNESNIWKEKKVLLIRITQQIMLGTTKNNLRYRFIECVFKGHCWLLSFGSVPICFHLIAPLRRSHSKASSAYMRWEQWDETLTHSVDVLWCSVPNLKQNDNTSSAPKFYGCPWHVLKLHSFSFNKRSEPQRFKARKTARCFFLMEQRYIDTESAQTLHVGI